MSQQSPMIWIPKKSTDDVDWTTPIQLLIAQSYGERPENYSAECQNLQRCRQDAVRGAGSDMTARDLLYKYFGQLELLELRFSEIKVQFPWRDAFTNKLTSQTSLAFEKASIIFLLASTHSAIGASQNRSDPESLKRAVHYFKSAAGMLNYINENFLHAPSTDLSREVIQLLVGIMLAQATESVFEKCVQEKKLSNALIAKIGSQAASMYVTLSEEVKEFMGKGLFDRNWVTLLQIKSKYFTSLMQYYRALADEAAERHGDALVRLTVAETNAKEAHRTATTLISYFVTSLSPNLPADAGSSILEITKAHLATCTEKKKAAQRDNDLIYNAILPAEGTLPVIEKTNVAQPISIQEVYGTPAIQKTIGPDIFQRLIPLSVHEGASVYSEEKAKLVRGEVEKAEIADGDVRAGLESIGVKQGLGRFREMVDAISDADVDPVPPVVRGWREEVAAKDAIEPKLRELERLRGGVREELDSAGRALELESRECEMMRVRFEHLWTQAPSAGSNKTLRQDLKSHLAALEQAQNSDAQVVALWNDVRGEVEILADFDGKLEACFREEAGPRKDLLDLDISANSSDDAEKEKIANLVKEIDEKLGRINKLERERNETLKELKEKIQSDDVSHILLLNRRGSSFEPGLFAQELEKFKPFQSRVAVSIQLQQSAVQEIAQLWKSLKDVAGRGAGARKWEERERKKMDMVRRFARAREAWMEASEGLVKGLQFYRDLTHGTASLHTSVKDFVNRRNSEREELVAQAEIKQRLSATSPHSLPPLPPKQSAHGLESSMNNLSMRGTPPPKGSNQYGSWSSPSPSSLPRPPPPPQQYSGFPPPPSSLPHTSPPYANGAFSSSHNGPQRQQSTSATTRLHSSTAPPPTDPYANLFNSPGLPSQFSPQGAASHQSLQQNYYSPTTSSSSTVPQSPYPSQHQTHSFGQPGQQHYQAYGQQTSPPLPPPPPPLTYLSQQPGTQPNSTQYGQNQPYPSNGASGYMQPQQPYTQGYAGYNQ